MNHTRIISLLLALFLLAAVIPAGLAAETEPEETAQATAGAVEETQPVNSDTGTCGDGLTWELKDGTLTITGSGEMADGAPWKDRAQEIGKVVFTGGVTKVGTEAFYACKNLKTVDFGGSMREIGPRAFQFCSEIQSIRLPKSFRIFGPASFVGCTSLETVYCEGPMPSFRSGCFWNESQVVIYYPQNAPWPQDEVQKLTTNFGGRLVLKPSEEAVPAETQPLPAETEAPTEAPTEATLPAETEPPVTAPAVTQPEATLPPETTPQETDPPVVYTLPTMARETPEPEAEAGGISGIVIGIVLVGGVLTFFLIGALIARSARHRGGRYYH